MSRLKEKRCAFSSICVIIRVKSYERSTYFYRQDKVTFREKVTLGWRNFQQIKSNRTYIYGRKTFQRIKELTELQGTSGFEDDIRAYMKEHITPLVDDVQYDGLGGIFGIKRSKVEAAPRVMVATHMDEVGFMLTQINDNGLFQVVPLGGWNPYVVSAQRFTLKQVKGTIHVFLHLFHHTCCVVRVVKNN